MHTLKNSAPIELKCTQAALQHIQKKLSEKPNAVGLCVRLKKAGCSGWLYQFDYSQGPELDEVMCRLTDELVIFVQREHLNWFNGAILDYIKKGFDSMLTCINPNEGMRCGCGESFTIKDR